MSPLVLNIDELDRYNAGVKAAVEFNRRRPLREQMREAYWTATYEKRGAR